MACKFISFRHSVSECSEHGLLDRQGVGNPQITEQAGQVDTVVVDETSNSPAKVMSVSQSARIAIEIVFERLGDGDGDFTVTENG